MNIYVFRGNDPASDRGSFEIVIHDQTAQAAKAKAKKLLKYLDRPELELLQFEIKKCGPGSVLFHTVESVR